MKLINKKKMNQYIKQNKGNKAREHILKAIFLFFFIAIFARMWQLQVVMAYKYDYLSKNNRIKSKRIDSLRGKIYDRNGELVVANGSGYRLVYLNERNTDPEYIKAISELTGNSEEFIEKRIRYGEIFPYTRENILIEDLDKETAYKLMEKIIDYPYLQVQFYSKRKYLYDDVASHSIGYVKKISKNEYEKLKDEGYSPRDIIGKDGIEKQYNSILKGENGEEKFEVNALNKIQKRARDVRAPIPGKDIYLSLDINLQKYMEEEFASIKAAGAFIAINPKNGEIITAVSYPTYSLNTFSTQISSKEWERIVNDPKKTLTNKVIAGEYPPGSIFKVVSAFSFLESGIDPKTKYLDRTGYYEIGKWRWRAWKAGGHGQVDMRKSLIESANPYYYKLSDQIGASPIIDTAKTFGFSAKTGVDISGERTGIIPSPEWKTKRIGTSWYKGDTILMSIGQGYTTVTPIQIANAYSFLANKGYAYKPHFVHKIVDSKDGSVELFEAEKEVITKFPEAYYDIITDALIGTVAEKNGTTKVLKNKKIKIAAKSGTAQNSQSKTPHAWIAGYFPANDPEIVFVSILEGAGAGGVFAGAMAKKFIGKYEELKEGNSVEWVY